MRARNSPLLDLWAAALLVLASWLPAVGPAHAELSMDTVKRSDVAFTTPRYDGIYADYGTDMVGWGFMPPSWGNLDPTGHVNAVNLNHQAGVKYQARVEWDVVWAGMQAFTPDYADAAVKNFDGGVLNFPWNPGSYWFCSHQPLFDSYTRFQVTDVALAANPDFLMLDSQTSTPITYWYGGCFCDRCMADFRDWLDAGYTAEQLASLGVTGIAGFDYHDHLVEAGYDRSSYESLARNWPNGIPLSAEYRLFQLEWLNDYVRELALLAGNQATYPLAISTSSPIVDPYFPGARMVHVPEVSFFTQEFNHEADAATVPLKVVAAYKFADVLQRRLLITGQPDPDWKVMKDENRVNLARSWIAQAYANGALFMVPLKMWAYNSVGSSWYESSAGDFEYLYTFIDSNPGLFDDYEAVAHVGLVHVNAGYRGFSQAIFDAVAGLTLDNIPFKVVVAGDQWWPEYLDAAELSGLDVVVTTPDTSFLDPVQAAQLADVANKTVAWSDTVGLVGLLPREITVGGAGGITVLPRARTGEAAAPFVVHLVNRNYLESTDSMETLANFTLTLRDSLFGDRATSAVYHRPGHDPVAVAVSPATGDYTVAIPELEHWGVLQLLHDSQPTTTTTTTTTTLPACSGSLGIDQCKLKAKFRKIETKPDKLVVSCKVLDASAAVDGIDPSVEQMLFSLDDAGGVCFTTTTDPADCVEKNGSFKCKPPKGTVPYVQIKIKPVRRNPGSYKFKYKAKSADLQCLSTTASPWTMGLDIGDDCGQVDCPSTGSRIECPGSVTHP